MAVVGAAADAVDAGVHKSQVADDVLVGQSDEPRADLMIDIRLTYCPARAFQLALRS